MRASPWWPFCGNDPIGPALYGNRTTDRLKMNRRADRLPVPLGTKPMEARLAETLPNGPGWQFEPKWDGFRCLAFRDGDEVALQAKSGKPLGRYFPDIVAALEAVAPRRFVVDGELAIPVGGALSFEALQMRLHPAASRVRKLAQAQPAVLILFDVLLMPRGASLLDAPLRERRAALERLHRAAGECAALRLSPCTRRRSDAARWLARAGGALDGVVAKALDGPYLPGERAMLKVKPRRTADCVVGGFRYGSKDRLVASLLLGLFGDDGKLHHVGFTSALARDERPALTRRLERLVEPPGFTGDGPGGPSRWRTERSADWQPLRAALVAEVSYDHVTGGRFRHGTTLVRWRPDKAPRQCTFDQIAPAVRPPRVVAAVASPGRASGPADAI
ncbi:MAG: ATP-dependent DNA ligase [Rhodospirillales bacterium]